MAAKSETSRGVWFLSIVVLGVTAWILAPRVLNLILPPAELPNAGLTLAAAVQEGRERGVPVVAVASQPGCPPCRALERGALSDERVLAWLDEHAIFVKVDTSVDPNDAASLGTRMTPTTYMIDGYNIRGQFTGALPADAVLAWLEETRASIPPVVETVRPDDEPSEDAAAGVMPAG
ncbi:MAG: thioredoxin family protein [Planctomycetota bacterium]